LENLWGLINKWTAKSSLEKGHLPETAKGWVGGKKGIKTSKVHTPSHHSPRTAFDQVLGKIKGKLTTKRYLEERKVTTMDKDNLHRRSPRT